MAEHLFMKRILLLAGARPNFMKIAPLMRAFSTYSIDAYLVHTGQHYDEKMSNIFFKELEIPEPDVNLGVGPGDRISQTKKIVDKLVPLLHERKPDAILVVGDVTSTAAGAIAGIVAGTLVIHVEAGLRSFNWKMPEELNRMIADHHSELLFVSDASGIENLKNENILDDKVFFVGNIMIDTLRYLERKSDDSTILQQLNLTEKEYVLLTMHRPENVDDREALASLVETLGMVGERIPIVLPLHPRTEARLEEFQVSLPNTVQAIEPVGYLDMLALNKNARFVLTDSGGLQEETTVLGIPCITLRNETERPETVRVGTSAIAGRDREKILEYVQQILNGDWKKGEIPEFWDGHTAERIAEILSKK